ncbi:MAG: hypothetical protein PUH21_07220 [Prevotellaceae bacterium]|nr:hypothetical protein [Prevotellaceae bacterium]MDY3856080.1 hypothetical protein [Bacteroidaceae bacterium]
MLETYISRLPAINLSATSDDFTQALNMIRGALCSRQTRIIFTTAFAQYALEDYEVSAIDFLLKTIQFPKFCTTIDKAD